MNASKYLILFAAATLSQESGYLDLTTQTARPRVNEPTSISGVITGTGAGDRAIAHEAPQPLQLTISNIEGSEHKVGEVLIYEVKILNSSTQVVKIPWAISPREIEPPKSGPYQYWMAGLTPRLVNSSGQISAFEPVVLYGSDAGATMLELAPGHWARIRAQTRLKLQDAGNPETSISSDQVSLRVGAVWSLFRVSVSERDGRYHEAFVPVGQENSSTNAVPIHIIVDNAH